MNIFSNIINTLFTRLSNAGAARGLLERADLSRGLSREEAAQLRYNALAMLSVVR